MSIQDVVKPVVGSDTIDTAFDTLSGVAERAVVVYSLVATSTVANSHFEPELLESFRDIPFFSVWLYHSAP